MRISIRTTLLASAAALAAAETQAGAFMIREGSATYLGSAMAGRTSGDADISYALHNPAALRTVDRFAATAGAAGIFGAGDGVLGDGGDIAIPFAPPPAPPVSFDGTSDPNQAAVVPSFAVGWRAAEKLVLGLAVDSPFGLATEYDEDFIASFEGVRSELLTLTATPMASYDVAPGFTVAGGVMIQYADAELSQRVAPGAFVPGDGVADVSGDGWDWGITLGALIEPTLTTTIGINFQSGFEHELEGGFSDDFDLSLAGGPDIGGNDGRAEFDLPALISLGITQEITDRFRLLGEIEWTNWSAFQEIVITDRDTGFAIEDPQNYEDSFMVALGAEYDVTDRLAVRGGAAFDETPTTDASRTVRVPDGDRVWVSVGASYEITERIGVDAAYTYMNVADTSVEIDAPSPGRIDYDDSQVHIVGLNLRYAF